MKARQFTAGQYEIAMGQVTEAAISARRLCIDAMQDINPESESLLVGVEALLEKIGLIADHHAGPSGCFVDGIGEWVLPPAYHAAAIEETPESHQRGAQ